MIEIEDDVLHVMGIHGRFGKKVTESDLLVWFKRRAYRWPKRNENSILLSTGG